VTLYIVGSLHPEVYQMAKKCERDTIAGSWIGGGANQTTMLEVFGASKSICLPNDL
jgi:hypothetical protein